MTKTKEKYVQASGYIQPLIEIESLNRIINDCYYYLDSLTIKRNGRRVSFTRNGFDAIAVIGMSATVVGTIIANRLHKNLIIVRKVDQNGCNSSHSDLNVEGIRNQRYIFIDDLVSTGCTLDSVIRQCNTLKCKIVGAYMWQQADYTTQHFYGNNHPVKNLRYVKPCR